MDLIKQTKARILKKTLLIFGVFLFPIKHAYSQSNIDSLIQVIQKQREDTCKVDSYQNAYLLLRHEDYKKALMYVDKGLKLATKLDYKIGILNSYLAKGEYYETTGQQDSALMTYIKAEHIAKTINNRDGISESLVGQGSALSSLQRLDEADSVANLGIQIAKTPPIDSLRLVYFYMILSNTTYFRNDYEQSIKYDQKALEYNSSDFGKKARTQLNIGSTFKVLGNYKKTDAYYQKALKNAKKTNDNSRLLALIHYEIGTLKSDLKEFDAAKIEFNYALNHFNKVNDQLMMAELYINLGKIHREKKEYLLSIENLKKALSVLKSINSPTSVANAEFELGLTYYSLRDFKNAEYYFLSAQNRFKTLKDVYKQRAILMKISKLYASLKNYKKAYNYLDLVKTQDDSLFDINTEKSITEIEEKYQNKQKQQEIELLSAENEIASLKIEKQNNLRNYLILAAILLVILIIVLYNSNQLKAKANKKLKELDSLKTNFFTNVSHEFRTPLTLILSPLHELRKRKLDSDTSTQLEIIHRNANVLSELTNQLLDLSKLEAGNLSLSVSKDDLNAFLRVLSASFESLAIANNIALHVDIKNIPEQAYFDRDKIQKIVNNLMSNAFKFTSENGSVSMIAKHQGNNIVIEVSDTGNGITPEDQKEIFNRFYQSSTNSSSSAGTGIGLTLAKELAQLHKGDITVSSEVGYGASFRFAFPLHKAAYSEDDISEETKVDISVKRKSIIPGPSTSKQRYDNSKIQILVVEDNKDLSAHISNLLKPKYHVRHAYNGKAGVESAIKHIPDLIITDLMMPKMDGISLNKAIKNNEKTSHIPVVFLTAKADRNTKLESLKTGADDFLVKPFDNEELLVRIENIITQRQKLQQKFAQTLTLSPSKIEIQSKEEAFIKKALEVVDYNLSNSEFSVESFQKEMGMSRMQLHRKLKALTNFSASEFIRDIRLQRAADLLTNKDLNINEIAYSCGFNSPSYFTQCFSQKFGASPSRHSSKT
jgi:signal transduction histidine kinase/DNA-binding response OmpR family regulator